MAQDSLKLALMQHQVVVVNKMDILEGDDDDSSYKYSQEELEMLLKHSMIHSRLMWMSAREGDGVDDLMKRLAGFVKKVVSSN